jgi:uncharacterized membrane protein
MDKLLAIIVVLALAVFVSFLMSWPVYMLWNGCLVGAIEGVKEIDWTTAWGITLLCGILFKDTNTK